MGRLIPDQPGSYRGGSDPAESPGRWPWASWSSRATTLLRLSLNQITPGFSRNRCANSSTTALDMTELGPGSMCRVSPFGNVTSTRSSPATVPRRNIAMRASAPVERLASCHAAIVACSASPSNAGSNKAANSGASAYRGRGDVVGKSPRSCTAPVRTSPSRKVSSRIGSRVLAAYHLPMMGSFVGRSDASRHAMRSSSPVDAA